MSERFVKTEKTKQRMAAFIKECVRVYGEASVVTRADLKKIYDQDREKYVNYYTYVSIPATKLGRGQFIMTANPNIKAVRDAKLAEMKATQKEAKPVKSASKVAPKKKAATGGKKLSKKVKASANSLAAEILKVENGKRDAKGRFIKKAAA